MYIIYKVGKFFLCIMLTIEKMQKKEQNLIHSLSLIGVKRGFTISCRGGACSSLNVRIWNYEIYGKIKGETAPEDKRGDRSPQIPPELEILSNSRTHPWARGSSPKAP